MENWKRLQKELDLTTEMMISARDWMLRNQMEYTGTNNITPEYEEMLKKYNIEGNSDAYEWEFTEDFGVYVMCGKMSSDLLNYLCDLNNCVRSIIREEKISILLEFEYNDGI